MSPTPGSSWRRGGQILVIWSRGPCVLPLGISEFVCHTSHRSPWLSSISDWILMYLIVWSAWPFSLPRFDPAGVTNQNPKTPLDLAFESNNNKLEVLVVLADYIKFADIPNHIKTSSEWQILQMERSASRNKKQEQEIQKLHDELKTMKEMLSQVLAKVVDKWKIKHMSIKNSFYNPYNPLYL